MAPPQTILNPEAPEFLPTLHRKLQQPLPAFPCFLTTLDFSQQHYYSPPPTLTQHQLIINSIIPLSELEPTSSEKLQQLNEFVVFDDDVDKEGGSSQEIVAASSAQKKRVFSGARGGCERRMMNGHDGFMARPVQGYAAWRKKGASGADHDDEDHHQRNYYCEHHLRRNQNFRRQVQSFNIFPNKKKHDILPVREDGEETTVMIKNIPAKYSRDTLVEFLDKHCMIENSKDDEGDQNEKERTVMAFDFVYLPIDFRSRLNKGFAFVNFTSPKAAWKFYVTASNKKWDLFQSHKIREVVSARLQGKGNLQKHFETMHFPCQYEEVLPVFYEPPRDGATKGEAKTVGKLLRRRQQQL